MTTRVLLDCIAAPWAAPTCIAARLGMPVEDVAAACDHLVTRGWLQRATQGASHLPPETFAPTAAGLRRLARAFMTNPTTVAAWARLTPERFWLLRAMLDVAQQAYAACAAIAAARIPGDARFDVVLVRRFRGRVLPIHARLAVRATDAPGAWRVFHVLIDDGRAPPTAHARTLRYLALASRRAEGLGLLIVTPSPFRAEVLLRLARDLGGRMPAYATWDRARLFADGAARWRALAPAEARAGTWIEVDPFAHGAVLADGSKHLPPEPASLRRARSRTSRPCAWERRPVWADGLERVESLDDAGLRALHFICTHPACPPSSIAAFAAREPANVPVTLERLAKLGLIVRGSERAVVATPMAVGLCALRGGREPSAAARAYAAFARERERRPHHARAVFDFFERLERECALRSRIARPSDAPDPPAYALATFDDELIARVTFRWRGERRFWWPDAYGRLRIGEAWTNFWLEIDGTDRTPARTQPSKWQVKLDALCAYRASGQWTYRFPAFPVWWVVTTDPANARVIRDLAETSARAYGVPAPEVAVMGAAEVRERGVLGAVPAIT